MTDQENYFKTDAKQIVDMLFNTKIFREDITRDDMNAIEEYIKYSMHSKYDLVKRAEQLSEKIKKTNPQ